MNIKNSGMILLTFIMILLPGSSFSKENTDTSISMAKEKALIWLKKQKVPNTIVPDPQPERRNLVISYEIDPCDPSYKYIYGRSVIYDDALAVIALTMNKEYKTAAQILLAMERLQRKDGSLWFGYNVNNDWPSEADHDGAIERTGASAWVGYSAVYYLKTRAAEDKLYMKSNPESKKILKLARSLGNYLLKKQIPQSKDIRSGLITGGKNTYTLAFQNNRVNEIFRETDIEWISSEHNIDLYFFLRDLGLLTKEKAYIKSAETIKKSMEQVWSEEHKQYYRGIRPGYIDDVLALDCASWGAVFSLSADKPDYAKQSLETIEKLYASKTEAFKEKITVQGYKPYANKEIYEEFDSSISKFYFPDLKRTTWDAIDGVWVEGSAGVAFAYLKTGNHTRAEEILINMLPLQDKNGGFIYFTFEIPHEFSTYVSVASTAWFIMVASALENHEIEESFWGK